MGGGNAALLTYRRFVYFRTPHFRRKLKMYEEQELTMQVFSEPDMLTNEPDIHVSVAIYLQCLVPKRCRSGAGRAAID